jgi:hypothetical protein
MPEIKEPSQRKRDAASANGKLARGSKTPEGKARSAMNAVTHGFTATIIILAGEDRGAFERLLAAYAERFQPVDAVEMDMLQDIVIAKWRHRRGAAFEAATIDDEVESQRADTYRRRSESTSELTRSALAYRDVEDRTGIISAMNRHQARQYREYRQAIRLLVEFQRDRPPNEKVQNEPSPTNGHLEIPTRQSNPSRCRRPMPLRQQHASYLMFTRTAFELTPSTVTTTSTSPLPRSPSVSPAFTWSRPGTSGCAPA